MNIKQQVINVVGLFIIAFLSLVIFKYLGILSSNTTVINNIYSTGGNIISGVNIDIPKTEYTIYQSYYKSGNFVSFSPQAQKGIASEMIPYVSNNTFQFTLPRKPQNGYLYVRLKNPTDNDVFIYWYNSKILDQKYTVSGYLKKESLIYGSKNEYLYKLNNIEMTPYTKGGLYIYDRQKYLQTGDQNFIAGYVKDFGTNNKIEEITIARE